MTPAFIRSFARRCRSHASGCLLWIGGVRDDGYGRVVKDGKRTSAHRVAWEIANGPIPGELQVLHHCDTPLCVNTVHLFLGTNADNMADKAAKGRAARKLDATTVEAIRAMRGEMSQDRIAKRFCVSQQTVSKLFRRVSWKSAA